VAKKLGWTVLNLRTTIVISPSAPHADALLIGVASRR